MPCNLNIQIKQPLKKALISQSVKLITLSSINVKNKSVPMPGHQAKKLLRKA